MTLENSNNAIPVGKLKSITRSFGPGERMLFSILGIVWVVSGLYILAKLNERFLVEVPAKGGSLIEGLVGSARFINPVLSISDTDKSIVTLIYSGLLKPDGRGNFL